MKNVTVGKDLKEGKDRILFPGKSSCTNLGQEPAQRVPGTSERLLRLQSRLLEGKYSNTEGAEEN